MTADCTQGNLRATSIGSLGVVEAWRDAVNRGDGDGVERLSAEHVEVTGPRGSGLAPRRTC